MKQLVEKKKKGGVSGKRGESINKHHQKREKI